jgi:hypothetical protein
LLPNRDGTSRLRGDDKRLALASRRHPASAIDKAMADCAAQSKNAQCILYTANNRVVFGGG